MNKKINELVNLQNTLNNMTNGKDWIKGTTNKGKEINWFTANLLEAAEAIESTPWKHWKSIKGKTDIENMKIEIVDIFHFLISQSIVEVGIKDTINKFQESFSTLNIKNKFDFKILNIKIKKFMLITLSKELEEKNQYSLQDWINSFKEMLEHSTMSFEELYKLYIMKNALNKIRQNNGYKEGTYIKIWNGEEDNVYLYNLLETNPNLTFEEIINNLQQKYNAILKDN